jgi:hypothetical protein
MTPEDDIRARIREDPRAVRHELLALESPAILDFDDPALESRRLFSEVLGTFMLVMAGAGAGVVDAVSGGEIGRTAAVTAPGLTVMAVILFWVACLALTSTRWCRSPSRCAATSRGSGASVT